MTHQSQVRSTPPATLPRRVRDADRMDAIDWQIRNGAEIPEAQTMRAGITRRIRKSPVDVLLSRKGINSEQWEAAKKLYEAYALGVVGVRDIDEGETPPGTKGAGGLQGYAAAQLDALAVYRQAVAYIGRPLAAVVVPVVCREEAIADVASTRGERQEAVSGVLKVGLEMLAIHFALVKVTEAQVDDVMGERVTFRRGGTGKLVMMTGGEGFVVAR